MDIITLITYICGVLGGILLLLCIILVGFFIFTMCRKHLLFPGINQYVVVPTGDHPSVTIGNGETIRRKDSSIDDDVIIAVTTEAEIPSNQRKHSGKFTPSKGSGSNNKNSAAPVKKKLLWKRNKKKSFSEGEATTVNFGTEQQLHFSDDELNVPREPLFKKNKSRLFKPRSKSQWDLPTVDHIQSSEQFSKLLNWPEEEEDLGKSQYFDAMESIQEEEEQTELVNEQVKQQQQQQFFNPVISVTDYDRESLSSSDWEDMDTDLNDIPVENTLQMTRFLEEGMETEATAAAAMPRDRRRLMGAKVKRRVKAMKRLQAEARTIEAKFYREMHSLECEYDERFFQDLHSRMREIVQGNQTDPNSGIQDFWLHAMLNSETLKSIIQYHDVPLLKHLIDVRVVQNRSDNDFDIEFEFSENDYFGNEILTKHYEVRLEDPEECSSAAAATAAGPRLVNCRGCKIQWRHRSTNVTLRAAKKMDSKGEISHRWVKRNSFFNFFTPPKLEEQEERQQSLLLLMEAHFQIGLYLKDEFVPRAAAFFLGEMEGNGNSGNKRRDSRTWRRKRRLGSHSSSIAAVEEEEGLDDNQNETTMGLDKFPDLQEKDSDLYSCNSSNLNAMAASSNVDDPIIGRYRMISSDGFDDFMKALGVGLVQRKLANSVSPVNVVEIDKEGTYTIRTETRLRTNEVKFKLNETFTEHTTDGRTTKTMPTREGNVITLDQKGDESKKEKNTKMIRDFQGDKMFMEIHVDKVVCKRVYERILH